MPAIHFFPGTIPFNLIARKLLTPEAISQAFSLAKKSNAPAYVHFNAIHTYASNENINSSAYEDGDYIVAGSAGGGRAQLFIEHLFARHKTDEDRKMRILQNLKIVAFEAVRLVRFNNNGQLVSLKDKVWHFLSPGGSLIYARKEHRNFIWDDKTIGHNSYMIHPDRDEILSMKKNPENIENAFGNLGKFVLFDEVIVKNQDSTEPKVLRNVLIRCDQQDNIIKQDQSTILLDVLVKAAYARVKNDPTIMPEGFSAKEQLKEQEKKSWLGPLFSSKPQEEEKSSKGCTH